MTGQLPFRIAFLILLGGLLAMRAFFMLRVHQAGERLLPDKNAVQQEGGIGVLIARAVLFFVLLALLVMYAVGMAWIGFFTISLPIWLRWAGFGLGIFSLAFWTWTQVTLDTHWSAQLQLRTQHQLVTNGPYRTIRHPLYAAMFAWAIALALLTANWLFVLLAVLVIAGTAARVPKEETMMLEAFGDEYRSYIQRTGRYLPMFRRR